MAFSKTFALIGAAGYVAPRHMNAIRETGCQLVAALDPNDSAGVIDSYFPEARFFVEFERFDRHIDKLKRQGKAVDYVSICSPNYLHDAHVRFSLRSHADVICEKPLVLNPWNIDGLSEMEQETGNKVNTILQLRVHPQIISLKKKIEENPDRIYDVDLTYITSRGRWYQVSWKGDIEKSGGVASNIGVHFFDMLTYVFGDLKKNTVHLRDNYRSSGYLEFEKARVRWFLSIDREDLPDTLEKQQMTYRSITVDGEEIEFSNGFTDLHTESYKAILKGSGFGLNDVRPSIEMISDIRDMPLQNAKEERHPFAETHM